MAEIEKSKVDFLKEHIGDYHKIVSGLNDLREIMADVLEPAAKGLENYIKIPSRKLVVKHLDSSWNQYETKISEVKMVYVGVYFEKGHFVPCISFWYRNDTQKKPHEIVERSVSDSPYALIPKSSEIESYIAPRDCSKITDVDTLQRKLTDLGSFAATILAKFH